MLILMQSMINSGGNNTLRYGSLIPSNGQNMTVNGGHIVGLQGRTLSGVKTMPNCGTIGISGITMREMMVEKAV